MKSTLEENAVRLDQSKLCRREADDTKTEPSRGRKKRCGRASQA
jgi:hypothetical protein